ncbi:MAG: YdeI/OmpD-associated family protein [Gemmatimonadetes bacterium]|nr:YdeI/OmpD-associated family protein [Gemmatimonadota bacterium]
MTSLPLLDSTTRQAWRAWLTRHHARSTGVWLVFRKAPAEPTGFSRHDAAHEALCFGWIDSLIKRLDDHRYAVKMTPRRPGSRWSDVNRRRWAELKAAGRLAPAGLATAPSARRSAPKPVVPVLPAYIARAFRADAPAWRFFGSLPSRERRNFVVWIHTARTDETRDRRIRESLERLRAGRRLGLK